MVYIEIMDLSKYILMFMVRIIGFNYLSDILFEYTEIMELSKYMVMPNLLDKLYIEIYGVI